MAKSEVPGNNFRKVAAKSLERAAFYESIKRGLTVHPRLITVDGPDGSGKGTYTNEIYRQLSGLCGNDNVVFVSPTRFDQSDAATLVEENLKTHESLSPDSLLHNTRFMAALRENYRHVILPSLNNGKVVVADSSEIRSLAFIFDWGSLPTVESTLRWLISGRGTQGISAGNRVIIQTPPEDCLANINARGKIDFGDPRNSDEATRRQQAYDGSVEFYRSLNYVGQVNWITLDNPRISNGNVQQQIADITRSKILPSLVL